MTADRVQHGRGDVAQSEGRRDVALRLSVPLHHVDALAGAECGAHRVDPLSGLAEYEWHRTASGGLDA